MAKRSGTSVATITRTLSADTALPSSATIASSPSTTTDTYTWNIFGELATYSAKNGATNIYSLTYDSTAYPRDFIGRVKRRIEQAATTTTLDYTYDPAGRLATVNAGGTQLESYTYDQNGNRISAAANGTSILPGAIYYDEQDRLRKYGTTTYTYTAAGNRATKTDTQGTTGYTYDAVGSLTAVQCTQGTCGSITTSTPITYLVDGQNRRVARLKNGVCTNKWIWASQYRIAAELDCSTGAVTKRFVYGDKTNVPELIVTPSNVYRVLTDQVGSVRVLYNLTTSAAYEIRYLDSFGSVDMASAAVASPVPGLTATAGYPVPFGFAGGIFDSDTKLSRFGARDYDSVSGGWLSKEPLRFSGAVNFFNYANGDPLNFVDLDGRRVLIADAGLKSLYDQAKSSDPLVAELFNRLENDNAVTIVIDRIGLAGLQSTPQTASFEADEEPAIENGAFCDNLGGGFQHIGFNESAIREKYRNATGVAYDLAAALAHEIGHAWANIEMPGIGNRASQAFAINVENLARGAIPGTDPRPVVLPK